MSNLDTKNRNMAIGAATFAAAMVGLAYASVPLYSIFCKVTGFGGTPQVATSAPASASPIMMTVRFDSNVSSELGWTFHAAQQTQSLKLGEQVLAHYEAVNTSNETKTGTAVFNVTPPEAGIFFNKIECFCFTEQTLKAGERVMMPVSYFIDPAIMDDPDTKAIREITLSYTFYPSTKPAATSAVVQN
jgi:cytochrome c oxidase assembly protein subunit 11